MTMAPGSREQLTQVADALVRKFGDDAAVVVERQMALAHEGSAIARGWGEVALILDARMSSARTLAAQPGETDQ